MANGEKLPDIDVTESANLDLIVEIISEGSECITSLVFNDSKGWHSVSSMPRNTFIINQNYACEIYEIFFHFIFYYEKEEIMQNFDSIEIIRPTVHLNFLSPDKILLQTEDSQYLKNCSNLVINLNCSSDNPLQFNTISVIFNYGQYLLKENDGIANQTCRVIQNHEDHSPLYIGYSSINLHQAQLILGLGAAGIFLLTALLFSLLIYQRKRSLPSKFQFTMTVKAPYKYDRSALKKSYDQALNDIYALKAEFQEIEEISRNEIVPAETFDVGKEICNADRNRYRDILPFDSNIVTLKKPEGQWYTKYDTNIFYISIPRYLN